MRGLAAALRGTQSARETSAHRYLNNFRKCGPRLGQPPSRHGIARSEGCSVAGEPRRWRWKRHHTQNIDALPTPGWKQTARATHIG
jgi:hypothetical protein